MVDIIRKAAVAAGPGLDYVLSDNSLDRYGDVIEASGWKLAQFKRNPVALFGHDNDAPAIGTWSNLRIEGERLLGTLKLAALGTSQRIDEIISLIEQGIIRAVSVGFLPKKMEPLNDEGGIHFLEQELLEVSVVNVPANANALALRKALEMNISDETLRTVFGVHAVTDLRRARRSIGESAATPPRLRGPQMLNVPLSERIEAAQQRLVAMQDDLRTHLADVSEEPDDEFTTKTRELNERIARQQSHLEGLVASERNLADDTGERVAEPTTVEATGREVPTRREREIDPRRPWAVPAKKVTPLDFLIRAYAIGAVSKLTREPPLAILKSSYGEDVGTREVMNIVLRAASVPADTITPAWAQVLVQTAIADLMDLLMPQSIYPGLSARGQRFTFSKAGGIINIPSRSATPTVAGSFVGEGSPIPVRQAAFTSVPLGPKKMAVITTMTREISEVSQVEQYLRNAIQEDTSLAIDTVLLDANAVTTIRPAGIRNGATTAAGTAGGGFNAIVADVKGMLGDLITASNGNIRSPVWIMNPVQAIALSLTQNAGGDFPFKQEVNGSSFQGYPLLQSATVPAGVVILVDAADFVSANGDDMRFDLSDQATLHMEDTSPAQIATAGTPNVVAAPTRSMFQTDSLALRMILPMNWAMRRTGMVSVRTAVTW